MAVSIRRLGACLGAEATGVDLRDGVAPGVVERLNDALHEHVVLCIRGQSLAPREFLAAARLFGEPVRQVNKYLDLSDLPEVGIISSEVTDKHGDGRRHPQGTTWHTDHSFTARPPKATMLHAVIIPSRGGDTSFCNMRAACAALPDRTKNRIRHLKAVHCYESSRSPRAMVKRTEAETAATPEVIHPLVRRYQPTGEMALYLSTTRLDRVLDLDHAESDSLLDELMDHVDQPRFHYHHKWRAGDLVIWDNRCSMHHANADYPAGEKRLLHRIMIEGEVPA